MARRSAHQQHVPRPLWRAPRWRASTEALSSVPTARRTASRAWPIAVQAFVACPFSTTANCRRGRVLSPCFTEAAALRGASPSRVRWRRSAGRSAPPPAHRHLQRRGRAGTTPSGRQPDSHSTHRSYRRVAQALRQLARLPTRSPFGALLRTCGPLVDACADGSRAGHPKSASPTPRLRWRAPPTIIRRAQFSALLDTNPQLALHSPRPGDVRAIGPGAELPSAVNASSVRLHRCQLALHLLAVVQLRPEGWAALALQAAPRIFKAAPPRTFATPMGQ
mmetsp:Transcript_13853/g.35637  ORF Transcript_13853/g.35637 Transcript_13853/m.35637 type:complete len:278 (+) Transcript_13853:162-995(+)